MKQRSVRNLLRAAPGDGDPDGPVRLVMTGGGARGAYQAGVLKRIGEIDRVRRRGNPFPIITAASAGDASASRRVPLELKCGIMQAQQVLTIFSRYKTVRASTREYAHPIRSTPTIAPTR